MKEAVKSDIFIMDSFFNIFQTRSGIISSQSVILIIIMGYLTKSLVLHIILI